MIKPEIAKQINKQLNREFFSAYFYLGLSAEAESAGFKGVAAWFMAKHREETEHAMKIYRYLLDHGAKVMLAIINEPQAKFNGLLEMFEKTLLHEQSITKAISDVVDTALNTKDHATHIFLQWFVTEQTEEEATVNDIISQLKLVGDRGEGLYMIDKELASIAVSLDQNKATQ